MKANYTSPKQIYEPESYPFELQSSKQGNGQSHSGSGSQISRRSNENLGRPQNRFTERVDFAKLVSTSHYYQSKSQSLLYVYDKLESPIYFIDSKDDHQFYQQFLYQLTEFIEFRRVLFIQCLELLTKDNFPKIQELKKIDFMTTYLTEMPSRTLGFALRSIKLRKYPEIKGLEFFSCTQFQMKCLYIATLLLCGCGKVDLSLKDENSKTAFNKIVLNLLKKTSMLTRTNFNYIKQYWDSIIYLILYEKIQTKTADEEKQSFQSEIQSQVPKIQTNVNVQIDRMVRQSQERQDIDIQYNLMMEYNLSEFDQHTPIIYQTSSGQQMFRNSYQDQLDEVLSDEFYVNKSSNRSSNSVGKEQQKDQVVKMIPQKENPKSKIQQNLQKQRQARLKAKARQIFNYGKQKRKRKPTKKQLQAQKLKKDRKVKKPHPPHKMRQIDRLVNFIIQDQFCIAYAIANHISNALEVQKIKLNAQY